MAQQRIFTNAPFGNGQPLFTWDESQLSNIRDKVWKLLKTNGFKVESERHLKLLEEAGAKVDYANSRVLFQNEELKSTCDKMKEFRPAGSRSAIVEDKTTNSFHLSGGGNKYRDFETGEIRGATKEDIVSMAHLAEGLDNISYIGAPMLLMDKNVPEILEPLVTMTILAKHTSVPVQMAIPTHPAQIKYHKLLGAAVERHRGYKFHMHNQECPQCPMSITERAIDQHLERVKYGCDTLVMIPMPVAGMTAPVTMAGLIVVAAAEMIGSLTIINLLCPQVNLAGVISVGILNMKTASVSCINSRATLANMAVLDYFRRQIGCEIDIMTCYREANQPGIQASMEFAGLMELFYGVYGEPYIDVGSLANGNLFCPIQAVLDIEILKRVREFYAGFNFSEEELAIDMINDIGFDGNAAMPHPHTLKHMRDQESWSSFWQEGISPLGQQDIDQNKMLVNKAADKVRAAIKRGSQADVSQNLYLEMREIVNQAATELGIDYKMD